MSRIKLELPSNFSYSLEVPVRIGDINYGGHLGNDAILSIMHEARLGYLNSFNMSELEFAGVSLIMGDTAIVFKAEAFHGDILIAEVVSADFSGYGFDLFYRLSNKASGKDVAHAKTGMVCFDYNKRKVVPIPDEALAKINAPV